MRTTYQCSILKVKLLDRSFFFFTGLSSSADISFSASAASSFPRSELSSCFRLRPRGMLHNYYSRVDDHGVKQGKLARKLDHYDKTILPIGHFLMWMSKPISTCVLLKFPCKAAVQNIWCKQYGR